MDPISIQSKTDLSKIDFNDILHIYKLMQKLPLGMSFKADFAPASEENRVTFKGSVCLKQSRSYNVMSRSFEAY